MALPGIIGLIGALASLGAGGYKAVKQGEFQRDIEDFTEEQRLDEERKRRMAAMQRASGDTNIYAPRPADRAPEAPDFTVPDIIGGLGQFAAQAAPMVGSKFPKRAVASVVPELPAVEGVDLNFGALPRSRWS